MPTPDPSREREGKLKIEVVPGRKPETPERRIRACNSAERVAAGRVLAGCMVMIRTG
ncbi:MAG: hypothetical protein ACKVOL_06690 [Novosphingobium sp.]